jgi:hypothetical protein
VIFSHVLYQLSYLGAVPSGSGLIAKNGLSVQTPRGAAPAISGAADQDAGAEDEEAADHDLKRS